MIDITFFRACSAGDRDLTFSPEIIPNEEETFGGANRFAEEATAVLLPVEPTVFNPAVVTSLGLLMISASFSFSGFAKQAAAWSPEPSGMIPVRPYIIEFSSSLYKSLWESRQNRRLLSISKVF